MLTFLICNDFIRPVKYELQTVLHQMANVSYSTSNCIMHLLSILNMMKSWNSWKTNIGLNHMTNRFLYLTSEIDFYPSWPVSSHLSGKK